MVGTGERQPPADGDMPAIALHRHGVKESATATGVHLGVGRSLLYGTVTA
ncbi:hypothetical protein ABZ172_19325 [Streptomyces sp. NPDC006296]